MKKSIIGIVVLSFIFLTFGCNGYNGKISDFNKHVAKIDKQIIKINKLQSRSDAYLKDLSDLSVKKSTLKKNVIKINKIIDYNDKAIDYLNYAINDARQGSKINASPQSVKYAQMLEKSFKARLKSYKLMKKGLNSYKVSLTKIIDNKFKDIDEFQIGSMKSGALFNKAAKTEEKATQLYKKAQDYYSGNVK